MEKENKYKNTKPEVIKLVNEIFLLALRINTETQFAVFFDFSGHVNQIEVRLVKNKEDYDIKASDKFETYLTPFSEDEDEEDSKKIIEKLKKAKASFKKVLEKYSTENPYITLDEDEEEDLDF